ncbi:unnamed protein product, partial [Scytosiphon promiscuus]
PTPGKTTVARLYYRLLKDIGLFVSAERREGFVETTGAALADCGTKGLMDMLDKIKSVGGGVLF